MSQGDTVGHRNKKETQTQSRKWKEERERKSVESKQKVVKSGSPPVQVGWVGASCGARGLTDSCSRCLCAIRPVRKGDRDSVTAFPSRGSFPAGDSATASSIFPHWGQLPTAAWNQSRVSTGKRGNYSYSPFCGAGATARHCILISSESADSSILAHGQTGSHYPILWYPLQGRCNPSLFPDGPF